jgi:hypothetical protein
MAGFGSKYGENTEEYPRVGGHDVGDNTNIGGNKYPRGAGEPETRSGKREARKDEEKMGLADGRRMLVRTPRLPLVPRGPSKPIHA